MPDVRALPRVFDELLWSLRRGGIQIPVSSATLALLAAREVGLEARADVMEALAAVLVHSSEDRRRFDRIVDDFFGRESPRQGLRERLSRRGLRQVEIDEIMRLLEGLAGDLGEHEARRVNPSPLVALLEGGAELDRLMCLAGISRTIAGAESPLQLGFLTHRVLDQLGMRRAQSSLSRLRLHLREAFGDERGDALADALRDELDRAASDVRTQLQASLAQRREEIETRARTRTLDTTPFTALTEAEVGIVRRAVHAFGERLRGGERVRTRRAKHGRVDLGKTMRRAMKTGGLPFVLVRRHRRRDKPRLMLLCDVSDSVRSAARFMLELAFVAHELFLHTRSFVFVSELGETTHLFDKQPVAVALGHAYGGGVVSVADNSNYGRVLHSFEEHYLPAVDKRTTVVILGDGRTNYHDDAAEVLDKVRARARALVWLCPEGRADWLSGDSAMLRYAPRCTHLFEVKNARELEVAARGLARLR